MIIIFSLFYFFLFEGNTKKKLNLRDDLKYHKNKTTYQ